MYHLCTGGCSSFHNVSQGQWCSTTDQYDPHLDSCSSSTPDHLWLWESTWYKQKSFTVSDGLPRLLYIQTVAHLFVLWALYCQHWIGNVSVTKSLKRRVSALIWGCFHPHQIDTAGVGALFIHSHPIWKGKKVSGQINTT